MSIIYHAPDGSLPSAGIVLIIDGPSLMAHVMSESN